MQRFFILTFVSVFFFVAVFGQNSIGVFAGPQVSSAMYSIKHKDQATKYNYGLQAGVTLKIPFENNLYFAPAIYYSLKGYQVTLKDASFPPNEFAKNNDTRIHTADAALLLNYDFGKSPSHFFIKAGPSLELAVSGHEKFDMPNGQTKEQKMTFSFTDYGYVSASGVVHFGYELDNGLIVFAHYEHGLSNISNADNGPVIRHRSMGISVGKYFKRRSK